MPYYFGRNIAVTDGLMVPHAVFGPLPTGADVRLLATTKEFTLSRAAHEELSSFYFAGWKMARREPGPYWAFFPVDDSYWGLAQGQVIGEGAVGALFVVWMALLDADACTRIGWRSHWLWQTAFPQPLLLPAPDSRVTAQPTDLADNPPAAVFASRSQVDALAFAIDEAHAQHSTARYAIPTTIAASPAAALFAIWERLGGWIADRSYCTSGAIIDAGFQPRMRPFGLVVDRGGSSAAIAVEAALAGEPTTSWLLRREVEAGIAGPAPPVGDRSANEIAGVWFDTYKAALVEKADLGIFRELAEHAPERAFALPMLLLKTVAALDGRRAATLVDGFVREILPALMRDAPPSIAPPLRTVTIAAVNGGLTMRLQPTTIHALAPELLGDARSAPFVQHLLNSLTLTDEPPNGAEQAAGRALLSAMPEGSVQTRFRDLLLGRLWSSRDRSGDPIAARIAASASPAQAWTIFGQTRAQVPTSLRRSYLRAYLNDLVDRVTAPSPEVWGWADAMVQLGGELEIDVGGHRLGSGSSQ